MHVHRPRIALHPPHSVPDYIQAVRVMHSAMHENKATFPGCEPLLKKLEASLDELAKADVAVKTGTHGMAEERNQKHRAVKKNVTPLLALVQQAIDAAPDRAAEIAARAGLHLHGMTPRGPQQLGAHEGDASGSVDVTAPSEDGGAHEFQCSLDGGKAWGEYRVSDLAHVTFAKLPIGATVLFRHRLTLHGITGDFGQTISFVVR